MNLTLPASETVKYTLEPTFAANAGPDPAPWNTDDDSELVRVGFRFGLVVLDGLIVPGGQDGVSAPSIAPSLSLSIPSLQISCGLLSPPAFEPPSLLPPPPKDARKARSASGPLWSSAQVALVHWLSSAPLLRKTNSPPR